MKINGLRLVYEDDFRSGSLDRERWVIYNDRNGENAEGCENLAFVKDGKLFIGADLQDRSLHGMTGCEIQTKHSLYFQYGYIEISAKLSHRPGACSAFWLNSASLPFDRLPEVDIYENFGRDDRLAHNLHRWWYDKDENGQPIYGEEHLHHDQFASQTHWTLRNTYLTGGDTLSGRFHRIGLLWTPQVMEFYVDGNCSVAIDITDAYFRDFHQPMHIILSHTINDPTKAAQAGVTASYDEYEYIRLYQDKDGILQDRRDGEITL